MSSAIQGEDKAISRIIQRFCTDRVFIRQKVGGLMVDVFRPQWVKLIGAGSKPSGERLSAKTLEKVQEEVRESYDRIETEHKVGGTGLSFDMFNPRTGTAIELCFGAITKEFHKDILKGMLDQGTHSLLFFFREYGFGTQGIVYGEKWFSQPAQVETIALTAVHKLLVVPLPLVMAEAKSQKEKSSVLKDYL